MKNLLLGALVGATPWALAHDGHGPQGGHWHASDAWGFVLLAAAIGVALWARRGK